MPYENISIWGYVAYHTLLALRPDHDETIKYIYIYALFYDAGDCSFKTVRIFHGIGGLFLGIKNENVGLISQ